MLLLRLGELRQLIREYAEDGDMAGSRPEEHYSNELSEDEAYQKSSVMVPDDVKKPINNWMKAMGLSGHPKKRSR